jgi:hypothetical protein
MPPSGVHAEDLMQAVASLHGMHERTQLYLPGLQSVEPNRYGMAAIAAAIGHKD